MSGDVNDYTQGDRVEGMGEWVSGDVNDYTQGGRVEGMGEWVSGDVNDYSQGAGWKGWVSGLVGMRTTTPRGQGGRDG